MVAETQAESDRVPSLHRPAGAPEMLLDGIADLEALARAMLALFGTGKHDVPDLRPLLRRLDAGDIGDFTAAAGRAYEQARDRTDGDTQTMDFVDEQIIKVVAKLRQVLIEEKANLSAVIGGIDDYLRRHSVDHWHSQLSEATQQLEMFALWLQATVEFAMDRISGVAKVVEEWIDMVRTLGPTPSPQRQLAAHAERLESLMKDLPVNADGTIRGGLPTLVEHVLRRGDLMIGDIHPDPSLKRWLADNMGQLHRNGVRVLMVEWYRLQDRNTLDAFVSTGDTASLMEAFRPTTTHGETIVKTEAALLDAARRHGIRIVAMDTTMDKYIGGDFGGRFVASNPFWAAVYQQERNDLPADERILVVGGAGHSRTVSGFEGYFPNVYSVDQYHPLVHGHTGVSLSSGQVVVHPSQPFPLPTTADETWNVHLNRDNADFLVRTSE